MTTHVGFIERPLRTALGAVLLYLILVSGRQFFVSLLFKYGTAVVGIVMLATSTLKIYPLYAVFGLKTCKGC